MSENTKGGTEVFLGNQLVVSSLIFFLISSFTILLLTLFGSLSEGSILNRFLMVLTPNPDRYLGISSGLLIIGMVILNGYLFLQIFNYLKKPRSYAPSFYSAFYYSTPIMGFLFGQSFDPRIWNSESISVVQVLIVILNLLLLRSNLLDKSLIEESQIPIRSRLDQFRTYWIYFLLVFSWLSALLTVAISARNLVLFVIAFSLLIANLVFFKSPSRLEKVKFVFWVQALVNLILTIDAGIGLVFDTHIVPGNGLGLTLLGLGSLHAYTLTRNVLDR
ncbi:MAG: hypothetical protein D6732_03205 [Methanobacteriota archaeon]|nr:MAG: hypothetical protein D6732_03205 [Euryarchaeota archaeon]